MKFVLVQIVIVYFVVVAHAALDFGVGTSSFVAGRAVPALAIGLDGAGWGVDFRGVGVQTTVYAQNAVTLAAYKQVINEHLGPGDAIVGAGVGGAYITRAYRPVITDTANKYTENVGGVYLSVKYRLSYFYVGADSLLGLTPNNLFQNIVLNFQDMSHITVGLTL